MYQEHYGFGFVLHSVYILSQGVSLVSFEFFGDFLVGFYFFVLGFLFGFVDLLLYVYIFILIFHAT